MSVADERLLEKVARGVSEPWTAAPSGAQGSILIVAAGSYGLRPARDDTTIPTGFDPRAAALFEAMVEAAYLVSTADGRLDDVERSAFQQVVVQACGGAVENTQIKNLIADLDDQLQEDGLERRISVLGRTVTKPEYQREILRVAGLMAHVSDGVSQVERDVLFKLATAFDLEPSEVDAALDAVKTALA
jgi:tellurite resistance protein